MIIRRPGNYKHECKLCGACCTEFPPYFTIEEAMRILSAAKLLSGDERPTGPIFNLVYAGDRKFIEKILPDADTIILKDGSEEHEDIKSGRAHIRISFRDGRCVFLDSENRCLIHSRFGFETKGATCRLFPLKVVETPGGEYRPPVFECPAYLELLKKPFEVESEKVQARRERGEVQARRENGNERRMLLNEESYVSWEEGMAILEALLELVGDAGIPLRGALAAGNELLKLIFYRIKRNALKPVGDMIAELTPNARKSAFRSPPSIESRLEGAGLLLFSTFDFENIQTKRRGDDTGRFGGFAKKAAERLKLSNLNAVTKETREILETEFSRWDAEKEDIFRCELRNYLLWKIFDVDIFMSAGLIRGFQIISIYYAFVRFYSIVLRLEAEGGKPECETLCEAIYMVEKYIAKSVTFLMPGTGCSTESDSGKVFFYGFL